MVRTALSAKARLFLFALLATVFDGAEITIVSYFMPDLGMHFGVGTAGVVRIVMYQNLASLAGGLIFGWTGDRLGRRWTLGVTVALYATGTLWGAFAHTFAAFAASRVLAGIGIGGEFGAAYAIFNEIWTGKNRGAVGGVVQVMFVAGMLVSTVVSGLTFGALPLGWQGAFLVIGGASLLIALAIARWMPESPLWLDYEMRRRGGSLPAHLATSRLPLIDLFRPARIGVTLRAALFTTGLFYASYSVNTFLPTVLFSVHDLPRGEATTILMLVQAAAGVAIVATGWLSDRVGRRAAVLGTAGLAAAAYLAYLIVRDAPVGAAYWQSGLFWAVICIQLGMGGFGVLGVWLGELHPTRLRVTGENFAYYAGRGLGASLGPYFAILLAPLPAEALGLGLLGAVVAVIFAATLPETGGREIRAFE